MCVLEAIATKCFENIADFSIQSMGADILFLVPPGGVISLHTGVACYLPPKTWGEGERGEYGKNIEVTYLGLNTKGQIRKIWSISFWTLCPF